MWVTPDFDVLDRALEEALSAFSTTTPRPGELPDRRVSVLHGRLMSLRLDARNLRDKLARDAPQNAAKP
jgi:hypothetical protein